MRADIIRQIIMTRKRSFICIALLLAVNVLIYLVSSAYLEPKLDSLQRSWSKKRGKTSAPGMDPAVVYRQGSADLATWRERIPLKKDFARFIQTLFSEADNNSLDVSGISYKPRQVKGEDLIAYSVSLNVAGRYAAIKSYIADIERLREMVVIDDLSLNGKSDEESVGMKIELTAYFRGVAE